MRLHMPFSKDQMTDKGKVRLVVDGKVVERWPVDADEILKFTDGATLFDGTVPVAAEAPADSDEGQAPNMFDDADEEVAGD